LVVIAAFSGHLSLSHLSQVPRTDLIFGRQPHSVYYRSAAANYLQLSSGLGPFDPTPLSGSSTLKHAFFKRLSVPPSGKLDRLRLTYVTNASRLKKLE